MTHTPRSKAAPQRKPAATFTETAGRRRISPADPISEGLRRLWAAAEEEPVPDDFLQILDLVDAARTGNPGKSST